MPSQRIPDNQTHIILDSITDGVFTVDSDWHVTSFNRAAEQITGIPRDVAIGSPCREVFRSNICDGECILRQTMETGEAQHLRIITMLSGEGDRIPVSISTAVLRDEDGNVIGGVESFRDLRTEEELRRQIEENYSYHDIVSKSPLMRRIFDMLPSIADTDSTVLIEGETGTGKELIARAIHNLSARRKRPLVAVNCSALPDQLLESELFGYKAGAFTDAKRDKIGRFAQARGGTIFLDEIGDISGALQVRLLRVLQERIYEPLGSVAPEKADVRVIAATNKNLETLTRRGEFRDDLYYRINVVRIDIPPLRNRKEDIPLLVRTFVQRFNLLNNRQIINLTADALKILMEHDFPGNVRELENVIEHAFVLCKGKFIEPRHLPVYLHQSNDEKVNTGPDRKALQQLEAEYILEALKRNGGNRLKTADELGMHKSTLFRKIRKLGIDLPKYDGRNSRNSSGSTT